MIKAYRLYTGSDDHSHVVRGNIVNHENVNTGLIHFEETPAHSSLDWHTAPTTQYVITLSGMLEFTMHGGESFVINPGEILIAMDTTGSGHRWKLLNDEPWRRAYITFDESVKINFKTDEN